MVGLDKGVGQGTGDREEGLRMEGRSGEQEEVELGVGCTVACEMMMSLVVQVEAGEGELDQELVEKVNPGGVPRVHIEVASEIYRTAEILKNIQHDTFQGGESR